MPRSEVALFPDTVHACWQQLCDLQFANEQQARQLTRLAELEAENAHFKEILEDAHLLVNANDLGSGDMTTMCQIIDRYRPVLDPDVIYRHQRELEEEDQLTLAGYLIWGHGNPPHIYTIFLENTVSTDQPLTTLRYSEEAIKWVLEQQALQTRLWQQALDL